MNAMADEHSGARVDIESEEVGTGDIASRGKTVVVRLRGTLHRATCSWMASSTRSESERVAIAGLEYGVEGMRIGGRRRIRVPPHLAYREVGVAGKVPSNALLFFDVELLEVRG